jgi:hypothetical protein
MGRNVDMTDQSNTSEPSQERLEELEDEIQHARRDGEEALRGSFYEGGEVEYADSGEESREDPSDTGEDSKSDDQNIAP